MKEYRTAFYAYWKKSPENDSKAWKKTCILLISILTFYFLIRIFLFKATTLPAEVYSNTVIHWGFLKKVFSNFFVAGGMIIGLVLFNKRLLFKWNAIENGYFIRNFIIFIGSVLVWMHAFYPYNYLFDQPHLADRLLLLLFLALSFWRPLFVIPLLSGILLMIGQFEVLIGYSLAHPLLLVHILILFISFYFFRLLTGYFSFIDFLYLLGCIIAIDYVFSGVSKLKPTWIFSDQINYVVTNSYSIGWLDFLDKTTISSISKGMSKFNILIKIFTLVIEGSFMFFFFKRKWTKGLLIAIISFHLGIFVFTGIFFWSWILVHLVVIFFVLRKNRFEEKELFNRRRLLLSFIIITAGFFWNNPVRLAWLDVPLNYAYKIVAETTDGRHHELSPDFFGGYDYQFTLTGLNYLSSEKRLGIVGGSTGDESLISFFESDRSDKEILGLEQTKGYNQYNQKQKELFEQFIIKYVGNRNQKKHHYNMLSFLKAPDLLWHDKGTDDYNKELQISKIHIECTTTYYSKIKGYREIRTTPVLEITVPPFN